MFVKCYIVEINSSLENMFDQLRETGLDWSLERVDENYYEITFETLSIAEIREAMEIMKWYV